MADRHPGSDKQTAHLRLDVTRSESGRLEGTIHDLGSDRRTPFGGTLELLGEIDKAFAGGANDRARPEPPSSDA